jgi:hypothetical protein
MAETVKILSPEKTVYITSPVAGCPMAEQMSVEYINEIKKENPDYTVVAYINTTAALKTVCDVCVTSASAVNVVSKLENDKILFIPDCNLGDFVAKQLPEKTFKFVNGGCPIHGQITKEDVEKFLEDFQRKGFLTSFVLNDSSFQNVDALEWLCSFWNPEQSEYLKEKARKGKPVHKKHRENSVAFITRHWSGILEGKKLGELSRADIRRQFERLDVLELNGNTKNHILRSVLTPLNGLIITSFCRLTFPAAG